MKFFKDGNFLVLVLYVDDMLIACKERTMINELKKDLGQAFEVKDLRLACQILGMQVWQDRQNGTLSFLQKRFVEKLFEKFSMSKEKVRTSFAS